MFELYICEIESTIFLLYFVAFKTSIGSLALRRCRETASMEKFTSPLNWPFPVAINGLNFLLLPWGKSKKIRTEEEEEKEVEEEEEDNEKEEEEGKEIEDDTI